MSDQKGSPPFNAASVAQLLQSLFRPGKETPSEGAETQHKRADKDDKTTPPSEDKEKAKSHSFPGADAAESALSPDFLHRILRFFIPDDPFKSVQDEMTRLRTEMPTPCIQLLGEPQVGKSSVVRALTGDHRARIGLGDGIPVTAHIDAYHFPPQAELPLWTFLDTPGLGAESEDQEPEFEQLINGEATLPNGDAVAPPHMLLVCIRADDEALGILPWARRAAEALQQDDEELPVLIVQTCLHRILHPHPEPYPFGEDGSLLPEDLPESVLTQLTHQRNAFLNVLPQANFVVVDITDPEDEVGEPYYGTQALLEQTYELLPQAVSRLLRTTRESFDASYNEVAQTLIWSYAVAAASAGALPPPVGDIATVATALTLLRQLAILYRQPWELRTILDLLWSLGSTTILWILVRYLVRRIPIPVLMAPVGAVGAFVLVFSLGHLMNWYYSQIRQGHQPKEEEIRSFWQGLETEAQEQVKMVMKKLWSPNDESTEKTEDTRQTEGTEKTTPTEPKSTTEETACHEKTAPTEPKKDPAL